MMHTNSLAYAKSGRLCPWLQLFLSVGIFLCSHVAGAFEPDVSVCVGRSQIYIPALVNEVMDKASTSIIARSSLDSSGADSAAMEIAALSDPRSFCNGPTRCGGNSSLPDLVNARIAFRTFLQNAAKPPTDRFADSKFNIKLRPGQVDSGDIVADFLAGKYVSNCKVQVAAATQSPPAPGVALPPPGAVISPSGAPSSATGSTGVATPDQGASAEAVPKAQAASNAKSPFTNVVIRAKPADLPYPSDSDQFKGLGSATLGFDANDVAHNNTYTASGVIGYQFPIITYDSAPDASTQIIPYVGYNLKKVQSSPHPKSGNFDTLTGGVLLDQVFNIGFGSEIKFNPQVIRSYQDGSEAVSGTFSYIPEPAVPFLAEPYAVTDWVKIMAQPNFNVDYERVFTAGENVTLRLLGNYTLFGPGLDLYIWGMPNSFLEQFSVNGSYRFFHNTDQGPDSWSELQTSLSYYPLNNKNYSITFKYSVGKDVATLASQKEYTLNLGIKY